MDLLILFILSKIDFYLLLY